MSRTIDLPETEKGFQQAVLDLARLKGWLCYHTHDSRRSAPGFPDAILIRGRQLMAWEFKRDGWRPTTRQMEWLEAFGGVESVEAGWYTPKDWDAVMEALS